jgi:ketosteroid isomerase-like protein
MTRCNDLFNAGDASHFREQFAADIVWLTPYGEIRGRDAVVAHLENDFVRKGARMSADLKPEDFHLEGDTYWMNYECKVILPERTLRYRATLISKLHGDKWQVQSAHYSPIAQ